LPQGKILHNHSCENVKILQNPYSLYSYYIDSLLPKNVKIIIYKTIILPVVLYECETWSLTTREEHRLRVFENRVLKRIFGPKRDEVSGS
jgi:hypothetical protein